ncbi:hypothetical protein [Paraburkholderia phosphatilytica]|uniref:hypothetical protein n=1 Tax=Paraburkholderia phosphatilytica TaxID=2282883 RepID=UPI000E524219|nr:hypothetical protein [Paraburkholderia phosphatilytica]
MIIGLGAWGAGSALVWFCLARWPICDETLLHGLANGYASTAGTMLGFVLAMITVLVSMSDRRLIRNMARTGHFMRLLGKLYGCAIYFGLALLVALPLMVVKAQLLRIGIVLASGLLLSAAVQLIMSGFRLWGVLKLISGSITGPLE